MTHKKTILTVILFALVSLQAMAFDGLLPGDKLYPAQERIFEAISEYWQVQENFVQYVKDPTEANAKILDDSVELHKNNSVIIGKKVLASIKKNQHAEIELLSDIYKSLPNGARNALYPTLGYIKVEINQENEKFISEEKFREYFPGYGYSEPGYKYRKGRELDREYKGVTWQSEEHSISTTWNVNLTISIDLLNIISGLLTSGAIKDLKVGEQYSMNVGGQPMIVCNVSFQRIKSIVTKTNRKFEINKVWFELLRAKSSFWSDDDWQVVGKTYEILQEPTGEAVVTGIEGGK
ncbi:MAG: hypothetical protein PWR01_3801 [Clostridiales bacterium]|jgi:hypothetical protein|nr:hypothetical protein [Clostridiales bacterium]MDN5282728.1 hypothetical protein [Candidatus Ozemobacter sp.]